MELHENTSKKPKRTARGDFRTSRSTLKIKPTSGRRQCRRNSTPSFWLENKNRGSPCASHNVGTFQQQYLPIENNSNQTSLPLRGEPLVDPRTERANSSEGAILLYAFHDRPTVCHRSVGLRRVRQRSPDTQKHAVRAAQPLPRTTALCRPADSPRNNRTIRLCTRDPPPLHPLILSQKIKTKQTQPLFVSPAAFLPEVKALYQKIVGSKPDNTEATLLKVRATIPEKTEELS